MARVEWAALEGGEAETVLSNLLYNRYRRAVRVRPAQGDYGIDVLIPATAEAEPWDVYQIKKFATNLTGGQKRQVEKSFSRLLIGIVRNGFKVNHWYLVMPLDPTTENLTWFAELPERALKLAMAARINPMTEQEEAVARAWLAEPGRQIEWKGLIFCESMAAEFPYVVDHYLHGGADRLRAAVDSVASLLRGDMAAKAAAAAPGDGATALLEPVDILGHLNTLDEVLDTDPHYRYGYSIEPTRPMIQPEPDLVAAAQRELPKGRWLTFKIYQRSVQSLDERPIPIEIMFTFDEDSPEWLAFEVWKKFGKPFKARADVKIDLPGGLGTQAADALVKVPAPGGVSEFTNRMRIVDPEGNALAELTFAARTTTGVEQIGVWTTSQDPSETVSTEGYFTIEADANQSIEFTFEPLAGRSVTKTAPAVRFARHLHGPNRLQIAGPVGPFRDLHLLDAPEPPVAPLIDRIVQALIVIQTRITTLLTIPDFSKFTEDDVKRILRADHLITGSTLVLHWEKLKVDGVPVGTLEIGGHYQLATYEPLVAQLDGVKHLLGAVEHTMLSALIVADDDGKPQPVPHLNDTVHSRFIEKIPEPIAGAPAGAIPVRGLRLGDAMTSPRVHAPTGDN